MQQSHTLILSTHRLTLSHITQLSRVGHLAARDIGEQAVKLCSWWCVLQIFEFVRLCRELLLTGLAC
jgi:hypothetical protein